MSDNASIIEVRLQQLFKPSKGVAVILVLAAAGFFAFGIWAFRTSIIWEKRLDTWQKVEGTIVEKVFDKEKRPVYEYEFPIEKRIYRGNTVVFLRTPPSYMKVGDKCSVLIDPANPGKGNALFLPVNRLNRLIFYVQGVLFFFFSFICIFGLYEQRRNCKRNAVLPEALRSYINGIPPEEQEGLLHLERSYKPLSAGQLRPCESQGILYFHDKKIRLSGYVFHFFHLAMFVMACLLKFYPLAAIMGVLIFLTAAADLKRFRTGVNFKKEHLFFESSFMGIREKNKCRTFSFSEIACFLVTSAAKTRKGLGCYACLVLKDGSTFPIYLLPPDRSWQKGLLFLTELAGKCGKKPLLFDL